MHEGGKKSLALSRYFPQNIFQNSWLYAVEMLRFLGEPTPWNPSALNCKLKNDLLKSSFDPTDFANFQHRNGKLVIRRKRRSFVAEVALDNSCAVPSSSRALAMAEANFSQISIIIPIRLLAN